jgi:hypothetical protein
MTELVLAAVFLCEHPMRKPLTLTHHNVLTQLAWPLTLFDPRLAGFSNTSLFYGCEVTDRIKVWAPCSSE